MMTKKDEVPSLIIDDAVSRAEDRHISVMLERSVELLAPAAGKRLLDCTCGMGGHSEALLEQGAEVVGVDRDPQARALAQERLARFGDKFTMVDDTFAGAVESYAQQGQRFDGILADLGVSSLQLDDENRGFAIRSEADVDMRMGTGCSQTACELMDSLTEEELANVIYNYGEERRSRRIAKALKEARRSGLASGVDLAAVIRRVVPGHHKRHPALRTFQALRIAVNDELGEVERLLTGLTDVLNTDGVAVVISFHSLEDRLIKNSFRDLRRAGMYSTASKKVECASRAEVECNRRSHSAKLRWAIRSDQKEAVV